MLAVHHVAGIDRRIAEHIQLARSERSTAEIRWYTICG